MFHVPMWSRHFEDRYIYLVSSTFAVEPPESESLAGVAQMRDLSSLDVWVISAYTYTWLVFCLLFGCNISPMLFCDWMCRFITRLPLSSFKWASRRWAIYFVCVSHVTTGMEVIVRCIRREEPYLLSPNDRLWFWLWAAFLSQWGLASWSITPQSLYSMYPDFLISLKFSWRVNSKLIWLYVFFELCRHSGWSDLHWNHERPNRRQW